MTSVINGEKIIFDVNSPLNFSQDMKRCLNKK